MTPLRAAAVRTLRARAERAVDNEDMAAGSKELDAVLKDGDQLLFLYFTYELLTVLAGLGLPPLLLCVLL